MNTLRIIGISLTVAIAAAIAILAAYATLKYPGSATVFVVFTFCFFALVGLIAPKPRLYSYAFFVAFLFLGFWPKAAIYAIWGPVFSEPVGDFSGAPQQWDNALMAAACGVLGVSIARILHLIIARGGGKRHATSCENRVPGWYVNHSRGIWIFSIALTVMLNVANYHYSIYKIGVNPTLILPLHINVILSWLLNIGLAMWMVTLVFWDIKHARSVPPKSLPMPFVEALLTSISAASRGIFAFHALPYFIAYAANFSDSNKDRKYRELGVAIFWLAVLFLFSIGVVFWLRMSTMHGADIYERKHTEVMQTFRNDLSTELPVLLVQRWVGLEGVLAVEAAPDRGNELLIAALTDSPKNGVNSLYQRIAKVDYYRGDPNKFTYLSNPGVLSILHTSGSLIIVFAGMVVVGLTLVFSEAVARRWTGNPLLVSVAGAGLANVAAQMTYPYLALIFLAQLWIAIGFFGLIQRAGPPAAPAR